jgi:class 3 adenylate cyclase
MSQHAADRGLAAILSADVVGYSRLMAEDEAATARTLAAYRDEIGLLVRQHRGRVVDSPGDNLLAEFPTATDAVEIQRVVGAKSSRRDDDFRWRLSVRPTPARYPSELDQGTPGQAFSAAHSSDAIDLGGRTVTAAAVG